MKITTFSAVVFSALVMFVSGCVSTPDGHSTPGMPFVKDTKVSRYSRPVAQLDAATRTVLSRNGKLLVDNTVNNTFQARINERNVWVKITKVDEKTTEVVVKARGRVGGDIDLAAEMDKQIALQLTVIP